MCYLIWRIWKRNEITFTHLEKWKFQTSLCLKLIDTKLVHVANLFLIFGIKKCGNVTKKYKIFLDLETTDLTTARTAEFIPWASPPLVKTAITLPAWELGKITRFSLPTLKLIFINKKQLQMAALCLVFWFLFERRTNLCNCWKMETFCGFNKNRWNVFYVAKQFF